MEIINQTIELTNNDTQSNVKIPFEITGTYNRMILSFSYGPETSADEAAQEQVWEAIKQYVFEDEPAKAFEVESYLPVENFITLSLSKEGHYLGGHHNKAKKQEVNLSETEASLGFWPTKIEQGNWELQLNCHCIASKKAQATIKIEVIK